MLRQVDAATGKPLVDVIVDPAGQKGTGRWTVQTALDLGVPVQRHRRGGVRPRPCPATRPARRPPRGLPGPVGRARRRPIGEDFVEDVRRALYASKIVAYAQGFDEIQAGGTEYGWDIDLGAVATIWRGGCIIRAVFLDRITEAYDGASTSRSPCWPPPTSPTRVTGSGVVAAGGGRRPPTLGIPAPGFSSALAYYDGLRAERLPAALIQGQRDFFGAHTYEPGRPGGHLPHPVVGDRTEVEG